MITNAATAVRSKLVSRFAEAYVNMAEQAHYRPAAPGDGFGNIDLSAQQLGDPDLLAAEASAYAAQFFEEEKEHQFRIGCSDFATNRALVYIIEAARLICGGQPGRRIALQLLEMTQTEIKAALERDEAEYPPE